MPKDLQRRADFPMLKREVSGHPLVYLDSAATALKPHSVIEATRRYYAEEYGTVHRGVYSLVAEATDRYNEVRKRIAAFINAQSPNEIVFTSGTTGAINLVATAVGQKFVNLGDEVVVAESAHHSNIVPWQLMCKARGATLRIAPIDDRGELILSSLDGIINPRTKIVAINHVSNVLGTIDPVREICKMAKGMGAFVLVDGAQAAPHMPVDVQGLGADFYAFSGHKVYGPTGIGVLFGRREILEQLPPYQGGGDMIEQVTFEETTYAHIPYRFEAGTPNIAGVMGLGAAIDYVQEVGLESIHAYEQELFEHLTERLKEFKDLRVLGSAKNRAAIAAFVVKGAHSLDIATMLSLKGICVRSGHHCAQPTLARFGHAGATRVSLAFYNTRQEIDFFVDSLAEVLSKL